MTLELLLSLYSAEPPQLSGTLRTIQMKFNKYNQLFICKASQCLTPSPIKNTSVVDNKKEIFKKGIYAQAL